MRRIASRKSPQERRFSWFDGTGPRGRQFERLEDRIVLAAIPTASLTLPTEALIGETLNFTVGFDDTSPTDAGYGPFVDLFLPATGADGAGAAVDDGITFVSATYLGASVTATTLTFNASGQATHPYARNSAGIPVVVTGTPGDQLVVLQLPFGSFTPDQPPAPISVTTQLSNLADVGTALQVRARGGFRYGNDALDNPTTDPTIFGATASSSVKPTLLLISTTYIGPEDETATGPNFPRQYLINVDVASGQTLINLDLTDILPNDLQYLRVDSTTVRGTNTATTAVSTPSTTTPGGTLTRRFASVTGTTATNDATLLFSDFVPRANSLGNPVINAVTGDDATAIDDTRAQGNWTPIDTRDPATLAVSDATTTDHSLTPKSIAIQKSVTIVNDTGAPGASPGDTLEYVLAFQVSDYFAFQNLRVTDLLSDGQRFDPSFGPSLAVNEHGISSTGPFAPANYTVAGNFMPDPAPNDGSTTFTFRVSDELVTRGQDAKLLGGNVPDGGTGGPLPQSSPALQGATTGTIRFRAIIQNNFSDNFPSGDPSVDQGDVLRNQVTIAGDLLSVTNASTPTGQAEDDDSASMVTIVQGSLAKTIYAVNGNTSFGAAQVSAGDTITYRITYTLPTSDFENLTIRDFLPLPIFRATTLNGFDNVVSAAAPATGRAKFGPADTFRAYSGFAPVLSTDATSNSLTLAYGSFDDPRNQSTTIDLLFTVTVGNDPFADGLFLTNQANATAGTTEVSSYADNAIVQVRVLEPVIATVTKGVVATNKAGATFSPTTAGPVTFNAPGTAGARFSGTITSSGLAASPIKSNLSGIDAGDLVTFAIVIQNTGSGFNGAFDVRFRDTLPAGFVVPSGGLNLRIVDGSGALAPYTTLGTGLFDSSGGIELNDPGASATDPGSLDRYGASGGRNLVVVTYDLQADGTVKPGQSIVNTATLFNYASGDGGPDFTTTDLVDAATVTVAVPTLAKTITSTSEASTGNVSGTERVAVGEIVRYRLVTALPEGAATDFRLLDNLPNGLQYLNDGTTKVVFVTSSGSAITSSTLSGAGLSVVGDGSTVGGIVPTYVLPGASTFGSPFATGTDPSFRLGDLTNSESDADLEYVVLEFNALVLNNSTTNIGANLDNTYITQLGTTQVGPTSALARVRVAEPVITLTKAPSPTTGDAGDVISFSIVFTNAKTADNTTACDARLLDAVPSGLALNLASIAIVAAGGASGVSNNSAGSTIDLTVATLPAGGSVTVTFNATITGANLPGSSIVNTANLTYTSLAGASGTTSNPTGSATPGASGSGTGERTGSGGVNDNVASGSGTVLVANVAPSKSIVSTSEALTGNVAGVERVAIGEVVRYRVVVLVPEATGLTTFQVVDSLPAGLTFLNDGTARLAFVANEGGISSTALAGAGLSVTGNEATIASITPTFVIPVGAITGGPFGTGTDPVFNLGDLANVDSDPDNEYVVLEFNALVDNTAAGSNDAGDDRDNTALVRIAGAQSGSTSNAARVRIAEPSLVVDKTPTPTLADAGDTIAFRILVTNPSTANAASAFDARILDALPAAFTLNLGSIAITPGGGVTGVANNSAANTIDLIAAVFPVGGSVQIDFTATLSTTIVPRQVLNNVADANFTSLPGISGTTTNPTGSATPGASGSDTGERTGSGVAPNDLNGSGAGTVTINANALTGSAYIDANNNGVRDGGESGISGVTVNLSGIDHLGNPVSATLMTDGTGAYVFDNLRPGTYTIVETQPSSYLDGRDALGTPFAGTLANDAFNSISIPLGSNTVGVNDNFGEIRPSSIAGRVFYDANNNGAVDGGETGIPNATVTLTGTDDLGNAVNATTLTDGSGNYSFNNLRPGTYVVAETQPAGYFDGRDSAGNSGGTLANDRVTNIVLTENLPRTGLTFGELLPASLAGFVYVDANDDGILDAGEAGIAGVTVTLSGADDLGSPVSIATATDISGVYTFNNLRPGTYTLSETQPAGHLDGSDIQGTPGNGTASDDRFAGIALAAGFAGADNNFAELRPASLSGFVFVDADDNGVFDAGESGIDGVIVNLTGIDDRGRGVFVAVSTDGVGAYHFSGLRPGIYEIGESQPPDYLDGRESIGTPGGTVGGDIFSSIAPVEGFGGDTFSSIALVEGFGGDTFSSIVLVESFAGEDNNFGELLPSTLSGFVFHDADNDGTFEADESGIADVTVTLTGTDDRGNPVNVATITSFNGAYTFFSLRPGIYAIVEDQPPPYLDGRDRAGTAGGSAGNDRIDAINLASGFAGTGYTFGELLVNSISGIVYADQNNDGVRDLGEPGIGMVQVNLTGVDDLGNPVSAGVFTDDNGAFNFFDLRPGTYTVVEDQDPSYFDGLDSAGDSGGTLTNDRVSGIILVSDGSASGILFGELPPAILAGSVFVDANNDGVRQFDEVGIADVTITVTGVDDLGNVVSSSANTVADGTYDFSLRPGTYTVAESQPASFLDGLDAAGTAGGSAGNDVISSIVLVPAQDASGYTFGELAPSSLAGRVFDDPNNDGIPDSGESGIAGATITLTGTDDRGNAVLLTTTTDASGAYLFNDLRPGTYTLAESQPAGFLDGKDTVGSTGGTAGNDRTSEIVIGPGMDGTNYLFGELRPSSLTGSVFDDRNNDGVRGAGESGITGVIIALAAVDDLGDFVGRLATTGADGSYRFDDLRPGTYRLTEGAVVGFFDGKDAAGSAGGSAGNDVISAIAFGTGTGAAGYTFGELAPATIAGLVYRDLNNDGVRTAGESGIGGVTVVLNGTDDLGQTIHRTAMTVGDGSYQYGFLRPGTYAVDETQPAGFLDGRDGPGTAGSVVTNDRIAGIVVAAGQVSTGNNFGELPPASLAGVVFNDLNGDGVRQPNEPGISGVTITLTGTDDLGQAIRRTFAIGAGGSYRFDTLRPGTYALYEAQPAAYSDGRDAAGSAGGTAGNDAIVAIRLGAGASATGYTFGERGATLSGSVFDDLNGDGVRQPNEPGVPGVAITLLDANGRQVATTVTAADGSYAFPGLPAGVYTVVETRPGPFGTSTEVRRTINLGTAGAQVAAFGLTRGSLAGSVYVDANNNGVRDPGESGIAGVVVTLSGTDSNGAPVARTATTGADGSYLFDALLSGTYAVTEAQPAGYLDGKDAVGTGGGTTADDILSAIALQAGDDLVGYTFGDLLPSSLTGFVYDDADGNGRKGPAEAGIPNVAIRLTGTDDLGRPVDLATATGLDGSYRFDALRPGTYAIDETQPAGYVDGNNSLSQIVLVQGFVDGGHDFGESPIVPPVVQPIVTDPPTSTVTGPPTSTVVPGIGLIPYYTWRRALNPARFDYYHPRFVPILAGLGTSTIAPTPTIATGGSGLAGTAYYAWRRSLNPARFDHYHPRFGPALAGAVVPSRVASVVPRGPIVAAKFSPVGRVGASVAVPASLANRRALNPARFDHYHPRLGPALASGRAIVAMPRGPLALAGRFGGRSC